MSTVITRKRFEQVAAILWPTPDPSASRYHRASDKDAWAETQAHLHGIYMVLVDSPLREDAAFLYAICHVRWQMEHEAEYAGKRAA